MPSKTDFTTVELLKRRLQTCISNFLQLVGNITAESIQWVKLARIVEQDSIRQRAWNVFPCSHGCYQLPFLGRILMAIVGSDQQMIFAAKSRDVIDILVRFAGDKNPILAKHVLIGGKLPFIPK